MISSSLVPSAPLRQAPWAPFILRDSSVARTLHSALAQSVDRRPPSPHSRLEPQNPLCLEISLQLTPFSGPATFPSISFPLNRRDRSSLSPLQNIHSVLLYVRCVLDPEIDCKLLEVYVSLSPLSTYLLPNQQCLQCCKHWGGGVC